MRNNKKGITVTSITVYVILFFMFTTITTIISSRFNEDLFNDRGTAINITAINKLEYNLLKSADESDKSEINIEDKKTTLKFSNLDEYIFDLDKHVIYKNGGKLVDFLGDFKINPNDDLIEISVTLNKYTNKVSRKITINTNVDTYIENGLIARFDGINNQGVNNHNNFATTWNDLSNEGISAKLSNTFAHDGKTSGWVENGLLFDKTKATQYADVIYNEASYPAMTFEITMTAVEQLGSETTSYVYPLRFYASGETSMAFFMGMRYEVALMYGKGNNTSISFASSKFRMDKDKMNTVTYVQNDLTTRSVYINGSHITTRKNMSLEQLGFSRMRICSNENGRYIVHSVRVYNRALTDAEIKNNYNIDVLRFGE